MRVIIILADLAEMENEKFHFAVNIQLFVWHGVVSLSPAPEDFVPHCFVLFFC